MSPGVGKSNARGKVAV